MTEDSLCKLVERWNCYFEKTVGKWPMSSRRFAYYSSLLDIIDDLIDTQDVVSPQWVEASATGNDGTEYWARVDVSQPRFAGMGPIDKLGVGYITARDRAEYLADMRSKSI